MDVRRAHLACRTKVMGEGGTEEAALMLPSSGSLRARLSTQPCKRAYLSPLSPSAVNTPLHSPLTNTLRPLTTTDYSQPHAPPSTPLHSPLISSLRLRLLLRRRWKNTTTWPMSS